MAVNCSWTHGATAIVENPDWTVARNGYGSVIKPSCRESLEGWVHFSIPSPPSVQRGTDVVLNFKTGRGAHVNKVDVWCGEKTILSLGELYEKEEELARRRFSIPYEPGMNAALLVSVRVCFERFNSEAWIEFVAAGIEHQ